MKTKSRARKVKPAPVTFQTVAAELVDEAVEDLGHSDQGIFGDIGAGQYRAAEAIAHALIDAIQAEVENRV